MSTLLFWLVFLFPLAEVLVIARVGARIGFWNTLFLLIVATVIGAFLAQLQGRAALQRIQSCLQDGKIPDSPMIDGVLIFIGGLLFVFPGFISDVLGALLIFPLTRALFRIFFLGAIRNDRQSRRPVDQAGRSSDPRKPRSDGAQDAEIVE